MIRRNRPLPSIDPSPSPADRPMKPKTQSRRSSILPTHIALRLGLVAFGAFSESAPAANLNWDGGDATFNGIFGGTGTWNTSL